MRWMSLNEIREAYLKFFESKGHLRLPSFSLVPQNDPSVLLINAGMTPMKPYFTGAETPPCKRVATCQKCIRTPDIERVGQTARHGTYFEMLGNFSFGDYFKKEAIEWGWEFVHDVLEIPADKLYASIYLDDDEAFDIWHNHIGMPKERIFRFGKEDNFWEHGTGPCGPCSEIFVDRGEKYGCGKEGCTVGCDCDRYVEIWNLVFSQFNRDEEGNYTPLKQKNIDTGGGLERFACVMQDVANLFEVDTVRSILDKVCERAKVEYGKDAKTDVAVRVITDHIRSSTMMISDQITPGNSGRGYVLRRLIRRAARFGRILGIAEPFLYELAEEVIKQSGEAYPNLVTDKDRIIQTLHREEESFASTIEQGTKVLEQYIVEAKQAGNKQLTGEQAFKLHDTYGFPLDLTKEIAGEEGLAVDQAGFDEYMASQKRKGREDFLANTGSAWDKLQLPEQIERKATDFIGYDCLTSKEKIAHILRLSETKQELVETANAGDQVVLLFTQTPFYAERGGQVGDTGLVTTASGVVEIKQTTHTGDNIYLHQGIVTQGSVKAGELAELAVDAERRRVIAKNHTGTHILHLALRRILGDHVLQAGSLVAPDRLRFDFTHHAPVSAKELQAIELLANQHIMQANSVSTEEMPIAEAKALGAMALFGEKYGNIVRVVKVGDSIELCGGTHVHNSAEIGQLRIVAETGVASGVRRIEAVTGISAYSYGATEHRQLLEIAETLRTATHESIAKINGLLERNKQLEKALAEAKRAEAQGSLADLMANVQQSDKGYQFIAAKVEGIDAKTLRDLGDQLKDKLGSGVVVMASAHESKVLWLAMATKDVVAQGVHCGNLIKEAAKLTGGGGGGRPDMAQAGGKDQTQIDAALAKVKEMLS